MSQVANLTSTQQSQLDYLRAREPYETLSRQCLYEFWCKDCSRAFQFYAVCTGVDAIQSHRGHNTWITTLGYMNP